MSAAPLVVDDTVVVLPGGRERPVGRRLRPAHRQARVGGARRPARRTRRRCWSRSAGVRQILVVHRDSRWSGSRPRRRAALGVPVEDAIRRQCVAAAGARPEPRLRFHRLRLRRRAVELTPERTSGFAVREVWRNNRMKNQFTSSVLHEGFIYGLDESILACLDAATGELKWKGGRYGYGQVMLASGHLIVLTEEGELALVRATPGAAPGAGALPRARGQDVEPPGDERRLSCSSATSTKWRRSISASNSS